MKNRLPCLRRRRPAVGQLPFIFMLVWLPLEPLRPPALPAFWWRKRRKAQRSAGPTVDRDDRQVDRRRLAVRRQGPRQARSYRRPPGASHVDRAGPGGGKEARGTPHALQAGTQGHGAESPGGRAGDASRTFRRSVPSALTTRGRLAAESSLRRSGATRCFFRLEGVVNGTASTACPSPAAQGKGRGDAPAANTERWESSSRTAAPTWHRPGATIEISNWFDARAGCGDALPTPHHRFATGPARLHRRECERPADAKAATAIEAAATGRSLGTEVQRAQRRRRLEALKSPNALKAGQPLGFSRHRCALVRH